MNTYLFFSFKYILTFFLKKTYKLYISKRIGDVCWEMGAGRESGGYSKCGNILKRNSTAGNILCHRINSPVFGILISPCSLLEGWESWATCFISLCILLILTTETAPMLTISLPFCSLAYLQNCSIIFFPLYEIFLGHAQENNGLLWWMQHKFVSIQMKGLRTKKLSFNKSN